jgi:hypothetical protein
MLPVTSSVSCTCNGSALYRRLPNRTGSDVPRFCLTASFLHTAEHEGSHDCAVGKTGS